MSNEQVDREELVKEFHSASEHKNVFVHSSLIEIEACPVADVMLHFSLYAEATRSDVLRTLWKFNYSPSASWGAPATLAPVISGRY